MAQEAPSPTAQAIVVPAYSAIKSVAELKGKKIGFAKAAGVHYQLIKTLERAGLRFSDIEPAYPAPADGRAAFERGSIDAWVSGIHFWPPSSGRRMPACCPMGRMLRNISVTTSLRRAFPRPAPMSMVR